MRRHFTSILWALACVVLLMSTAEACPTCKAGLSENGGNLVRGYFWSIMFMMSMPFLILGGLSSMFYLEVRRARLLNSHNHGGTEGISLPVGSSM